MEGEGKSQSEYFEIIRANEVKERIVTKDMVIILFIRIADITKRRLI